MFAGSAIAAVGLTAGQARRQGFEPARCSSAPWAVAPLASEWIHRAALAIRARVPIDVLLDQVAQYPAYAEAYLTALERLAR